MRHPDFLKLWTAETISQFGTQVTALAIPLVAIVLLQSEPFEIGLLTTIEFLPFILVGLPAGVWVDRMRRRPVMIVGDVGRALALASIPVAFLFGVLTIWQLYVVGFVVGVLTVFFDVAYQSYLPSLVERDQLVEGNSKLEVSRSGAQLAGPGIAGVLIGAIGAPIAILLDAVSFIVSGLFVFLIRKHEPAPERELNAEGKRVGMVQQIREGLAYVLGSRYLRNIAACTGTANFFSQLVNVMLLILAVRELGMTAEVIGLLFAVGNGGFLLGAVVANRIAGRIGVGPTIIASAFITGPAALLVPIATPETAAPLLIASFAIGSFANTVYNINQVSFRQAITPDRMQGRMNATMRFAVWGTIPLGATVAGILGSTIGVRETIWIGAFGGFLAFLPVLFSPVRGLRTMPSGPIDEHGVQLPASAGEGEDDAAGPLEQGDFGQRATGPHPVVRPEE